MVWAIPRAAWITYFILMLVWITHTQGDYHRIKTQLGSAGFLSYHYTFMTVAWPICMFEAIFSYRVPLYKMPNRRCAPRFTGQCLQIALLLSEHAAAPDWFESHQCLVPMINVQLQDQQGNGMH